MVLYLIVPVFLLGLGLLLGCNESLAPESRDTAAPAEKASSLLAAARKAHGSDHIDGQVATFTFRGRQYTGRREEGLFEYTRAFRSETGDSIRDILNNEGFYRLVNGERVDLPAKDSAAYSNSVNSVLYFAYLPYNLTDPAVRARYIGHSNVEGEPYDKIMVTFRREGGGKDYEDEFVYWFHTRQHTLDYLAYNYLTDGGGARFRKAINSREVGEIRFQDYINFAPRSDSREVARFDSLFEAGGMEEVSRIELEDIRVRPIAPTKGEETL